MRLQYSKLFGALLLMSTLACNYEAHATLQPMAVRGAIQTVDYTNHSLTVLDQTKVAKTFIWNSSTWFREKTPKPCASWLSRLLSFTEKTNDAALQPGRTALIYWRRGPGRAIAREIVVLLPAPSPPNAGSR